MNAENKTRGWFCQVVGTSELRPRGSEGGPHALGPVSLGWDENYHRGQCTLRTCQAPFSRLGLHTHVSSPRCGNTASPQSSFPGPLLLVVSGWLLSIFLSQAYNFIFPWVFTVWDTRRNLQIHFLSVIVQFLKRRTVNMISTL